MAANRREHPKLTLQRLAIRPLELRRYSSGLMPAGLAWVIIHDDPLALARCWVIIHDDPPLLGHHP